jgi:hypothetical protein
MSPVIDNNGYIYLNSDPKKDSKYIIDCFDKKGEYLRGFLDRSNLFVGLYLKSEPKLQKNPGKENPDWYSMSASSNIQYSINKKDQLLVYSTTSGYFWVFTKGKLKRTGKLWPRNALSDYKICLKEVAEMGGFYPFFDKLLIDQDDPDNFLLNYQYFKNGDKRFLYKFDFSGKLDKVYYVVNPQKSFISFEYKKNRKFYGITKNKDNNLTISIYKEEKNE